MFVNTGKLAPEAFEAPSLAAAPGSQAAAQPFYYNTENAMPQPPTGIGRELKTVKPITPGPSTYVDHFPPKYLEPAQPLQTLFPQPVPFVDKAGYTLDYPRHGPNNLRIPDKGWRPLSAPKAVADYTSTSHDHHRYNPIQAPKKYVAPYVEPPILEPPRRVQPAMASAVAPPAAAPAPPAFEFPSRVPTPKTFYQETFVEHPRRCRPKKASWPPADVPTDPKEPMLMERPKMAPEMNGWQLPFPRKSLGLQIVDGFQGVVSTKDIYKLMIPGSSTVPATTSAVFTTVRDNQPSVCVLILHGDDPDAPGNDLIGQFEVVNIPPAPLETPRIKVTFTVDGKGFLKVAAVMMDTGAHKTWLNNGGKLIIS